MHNHEFRNLLEVGDVNGLRAFWARHNPNMPHSETHDYAEIVMHYARTVADSIPLDKRVYSHRWLTERLVPSGLPDHLRAAAEQVHPTIAEGVGIAVQFRSKWMKPAEGEVRKAMEDAVNDAYAEKRTDPAFLKQRMDEARERTMKALFGR